MPGERYFFGKRNPSPPDLLTKEIILGRINEKNAGSSASHI